MNSSQGNLNSSTDQALSLTPLLYATTQNDMTRGRKKDLTIPPTRALAQQRDYRARKARYVADLEERCKKAESESAELRKELEIFRAGSAPRAAGFQPEALQASSELLKHLGAASASLARFQQLAFPDPASHGSTTPSSLGSANTLRPASFPSQAPSPPFSVPSSAGFSHSQAQKRPRSESRSPSPRRTVPRPSDLVSRERSQSFGSEDGGDIDDHDELLEQELNTGTDRRSSKTSQIRSTSESSSADAGTRESPTPSDYQ